MWDNWTKDDIEVSIISKSPKWKKKEMLDQMFAYPFHQLKVNRITTRIKADNLPAIKLAKSLGFKQEGTVREALDGQDVLIFGILKREYYGQKERATATTST